MSLRAGRVGVNPVDVDPITGRISPEASEGYTKSEADDKFLSKSDASSTYESKTEASEAHNLLQPKTLAVPIEMLSGSKLTVESALQGLNSDKQDKGVWSDGFVVDISETSLDGYGTLTLYENLVDHLLLIKWAGNGTAPVNVISANVSIDAYIHEKPIAQIANVINNGNYVVVNSNNSIDLNIAAKAWTSGSILVPTKSK